MRKTSSTNTTSGLELWEAQQERVAQKQGHRPSHVEPLAPDGTRTCPVCQTKFSPATSYPQQKTCSKRCGLTLTHSAATKHGVADKIPEYYIWLAMRQRCSNPNSDEFKNYGGRGISICHRWNSFAAFLSDMGRRPSPDHSIDRRKNSGNYEPGNCRWATRKQQCRNSRQCRMITHLGRTLSVVEWAEIRGINASTIRNRLYEGWDDIEAITRPAS